MLFYSLSCVMPDYQSTVKLTTPISFLSLSRTAKSFKVQTTRSCWLAESLWPSSIEDISEADILTEDTFMPYDCADCLDRPFICRRLIKIFSSSNLATRSDWSTLCTYETAESESLHWQNTCKSILDEICILTWCMVNSNCLSSCK